ncbi:hypothetical protein WA556_001555 [Blastocystis sp. ATCC 50177/Nand II]
MNRSFAVFLAVLSITFAAEAKPKEFTIGNFFAGSWVVANRQVNLDTGEIVGEPVFAQYNVTKTSDNEYDIFELETGSYHRKQDADQVVMTTSSSLSCSISEYNAEKDGFDTLSELSFVPIMPSESYIASGKSPLNNAEEYEISIMGPNHFSLKFTNRATKMVTIYSATRVIIPPPLTFMQKYGMSLLMAGMIIIQMFLKTFLAQPEEKPKVE